MIILTEFDIQRFWSHVPNRVPGTCWLWIGHRAGNGYGRFKLNGRYYQANRIAWALANGRMPHASLVVKHTCNTPPCCNPEHLVEGTQASNIREAMSTITDEQVQEMRRMRHQQFWTIADIARHFGQKASTVEAIVNYRRRV